jgi:hypothetical protein
MRIQKKRSFDVEGSFVEFAHRIPRVMVLLGLAWVPLIAAPHLSNSQFSVGGLAFCGDVQAVDLIAQTFLIWRDNGNTETVPFSRWTDFIRISTDAKGRKHRHAIEPTDIAIGERLSILLDPNAATAELVEVLPATNGLNWSSEEPEKALRSEKSPVLAGRRVVMRPGL